MNATETSDRITNRVPQAIRPKLQEAAELTGSTLNQFMVQASLEKAERIIDGERTIQFSKNDAAMIINLLDSPSTPIPALMKAFERFRQREIENGNHPTHRDRVEAHDCGWRVIVNQHVGFRQEFTLVLPSSCAQKKFSSLSPQSNAFTSWIVASANSC